MKDKEKQIEEIIKEIAECNKESCQNCIFCTYYYAIKRFCEIFLPEDSVVLSKEEWASLQGKAWASTFKDAEISQLKEELKQARKETAEKFFKELKEIANKTTLETLFDRYTSYEIGEGALNELAKQFDVEVK